MHYVVTGGAGFIGGHLVESLINDGHSVVVIDNLSTGNLDNLKSVIENPLLDFVEGDILTLPELGYLISKADMVYHLAAAVGVELVVHDPVRTIVTNVHGTERILEAASRKKTKVLVTSTSEVYGKSDKHAFSEQDDLLIGPPSHSRWSYASSKLLDEFMTMAYHRDRNIPTIVVRLFNTVGPRQTGQYGMVVPRFVRNALEGKDIQVYGDGEQTRCFCHVEDTVRALRKLGECDEAIGNLFNIGNTESISIKELATQVVKQLGSKSKISFVPYSEAYEAGFEDMRHRRPDISNTSATIGWEPKRCLSEIIDDVSKFFKS